MSGNYYFGCQVENALSIQSLFTFFHKKLARDYNFKGESHDFHEVLCVLNGEVGVTADENVYILPAGQAIFHKGGEFHSLWSSHGASAEIVVFSFSADAFPTLTRPLFSLSPAKISELLSTFALAEKAFVLAEPRVMSVREGKKEEASAVIKRLEIFLLSLFSQANDTQFHYTGRSAENYARIVSVMQDHLSEDLSAAEIADLCNLSIPALNKTMARFAGCGVMTYYNSLRLKKAEELLSAGASVKEAALSVGFFNQNYFSACFKKHKGVSPSRIKPD